MPPAIRLVPAALAQLAEGGLACLPVDTVPGLACRADLPQALATLKQIKGRPPGKSLSVAFRDLDQAVGWLPAILPLRDWLERVLPGPLTFVVPGSEALGAFEPAWSESVGLRLPGPSPCSALLDGLPWPLALSSANISGQSAIRWVRELDATLAGHLAFIWPGESPLGRESTVVDLRCRPPRLQRPGAMDAARLDRLLEYFP
jgi:L-threonylcarbamoyladenylate synthase